MPAAAMPTRRPSVDGPRRLAALISSLLMPAWLDLINNDEINGGAASRQVRHQLPPGVSGEKPTSVKALTARVWMVLPSCCPALSVCEVESACFLRDVGRALAKWLVRTVPTTATPRAEPISRGSVESGSHAGEGWRERGHDARGEGGHGEPHAG
jgi:hypothetical protein